MDTINGELLLLIAAKIVLRHCDNNQDHDDLIQSISLTMFVESTTVSNIDNVRGFLYRTGSNALRDILRQQKKQRLRAANTRTPCAAQVKAIDPDDDSTTPGYLDPMDERIDWNDWRATLPESVARYLDCRLMGYENAGDIAARTGCRVGEIESLHEQLCDLYKDFTNRQNNLL